MDNGVVALPCERKNTPPKSALSCNDNLGRVGVPGGCQLNPPMLRWFKD